MFWIFGNVTFERNTYDRGPGCDNNPKYDQSSHVTRKSNRSVTFATSSKTTQHGPIYDVPEPLPMRRFQEKNHKKTSFGTLTAHRTEILQFWVLFCKEEV